MSPTMVFAVVLRIRANKRLPPPVLVPRDLRRPEQQIAAAGWTGCDASRRRRRDEGGVGDAPGQALVRVVEERELLDDGGAAAYWSNAGGASAAGRAGRAGDPPPRPSDPGRAGQGQWHRRPGRPAARHCQWPRSARRGRWHQAPVGPRSPVGPVAPAPVGPVGPTSPVGPTPADPVGSGGSRWSPCCRCRGRWGRGAGGAEEAGRTRRAGDAAVAGIALRAAIAVGAGRARRARQVAAGSTADDPGERPARRDRAPTVVEIAVTWAPLGCWNRAQQIWASAMIGKLVVHSMSAGARSRQLSIRHFAGGDRPGPAPRAGRAGGPRQAGGPRRTGGAGGQAGAELLERIVDGPRRRRRWSRSALPSCVPRGEAAWLSRCTRRRAPRTSARSPSPRTGCR